MSDEEFNFAAFSSNPFYQKLTDKLIELAEVKNGERIVDLACGTGLVTRRIIANLRDARDTVIIGVDHSATALKQAVTDLKDVRETAVMFVHSQVENVSDAIKDKVDVVFFCNAIHYVPDKGELLDRIGFFTGKNREKALATLRQALLRGDITDTEVHFLRGVVRKLQWYVDHGARLE